MLTSPQLAHISTTGTGGTLNFCANNYLGLANNPKVVEAARESLDRWGFGLSSVRFICGTQEIHKQLEFELAGFEITPGEHPIVPVTLGGPLHRVYRAGDRRVSSRA